MTECTCWRKHSVKFPKGANPPRTLECLQAAWDRDQELIEEQRQKISKLSEKNNQLRQKLQPRKTDPNKGCKNKEENIGWAIVHDLIAHPLMALTGYSDASMWFHNYTSHKAWPRN